MSAELTTGTSQIEVVFENRVAKKSPLARLVIIFSLLGSIALLMQEKVISTYIFESGGLQILVGAIGLVLLLKLASRMANARRTMVPIHLN